MELLRKLSNSAVVISFSAILFIIFLFSELYLVNAAESHANEISNQLQQIVTAWKSPETAVRNDAMIKQIAEAAQLLEKNKKEGFGFWSSVLFTVVLAAVFIAVYLFLMRRRLFSPLNHIGHAFDSVKKGDFTKKVYTSAEGELEPIVEGFNRTIESIEHILKTIKVSSEQVLTSAQEVSSGNNQLSTATQQMASSLEETAASVEEITASIQEAASLSGEAATKMRKTTVDAEGGAKMLREMGDAMKSVKESGDKIQEIVNVVNDIAFQTNLLALNAAVEAARAGEEGKGFAVVASEVRSLAARSADAATEIKELVEKNEENIRNANDLSLKTTNVLLQLINRIQEASFSIQDIEKRAREQASGIHQINAAIMQMDEVTQRNASLVEELASSAEDMAHISRDLSKEVEKFKVGEVGSGIKTRRREEDPYLLPDTRIHKRPEPAEKTRQPIQVSSSKEKTFFDDDQFEEF